MPEKLGTSALSALSALPASTNSSSVVGTCRPAFSKQVLAVHDDAGAAVVGHAVELAVVGAGLDQAVDEVVAAQVVLEVGQVDHGAGRLEAPGPGCCRPRRCRGCPRWAAPCRAGSTSPSHSCRSTSTVTFGYCSAKVVLRQLDHLVGRVGPVEPDAQRRLGVARRRLERHRRLRRRRRRRAARGQGEHAGQPERCQLLGLHVVLPDVGRRAPGPIALVMRRPALGRERASRRRGGRRPPRAS